MKSTSQKTVLLCSVGISGLALLAGLLIARSSDNQADHLANRLDERLHDLESRLAPPSSNPSA